MKATIDKVKGCRLLSHKTGRIVVFVFFVLIVALALFGRYKISWCNENCAISFDPGFESLVGSEDAFVNKDVSSDGMFVTYTTKGYIDGVDKDEWEYEVRMNDYFERTAVNGAVPEVSFVIDAERCGEDCSSILDELKQRKETLQLNELIGIEVTYGLEVGSIFERCMYAWDRVRASFGDHTVDASSYVSASTVTYTVYSLEELNDSCAALAEPDSLPSTAANLYASLVDVVRNDALLSTDEKRYSGSLATRLFGFDAFTCETCDGGCAVADGGIGLDYVFFPMYVAGANKYGAEIDDEFALEVLAESYGADSYATFEDFVNDESGQLHAESPYILWGNEPVCMPYALATALGIGSGVDVDVYEKLCMDRGRNEDYLNQEESTESGEVFSLTDDQLFSDLELLFTDYAAFLEQDHIAGRNSSDTWITLGLDDYVYGYESGNMEMVEDANWFVLWGAWYFVDRMEIEPNGADWFAEQYRFRLLLDALEVKKLFAKDLEVTSEVDRVVNLIAEELGGAEYVERAYDVEAAQIKPELNISERYLMWLNRRISLWILAPDFYDTYLEDNLDTAVGEWFSAHMVDEDCGRMNKGYFVHYNSSGECIQYSFGMRSNLTSMLYLLMAQNEK